MASSRQRRRRLERRRAFSAAHRGAGRPEGSAPPLRGNVRVTRHPDGGHPVGATGTIGRPHRRMQNAVSHGEWLEREIARAETPGDNEALTRALFIQIGKVERLQHVLTRTQR